MEGPAIRVIADRIAKFKGTEVFNASGNTKIEKKRIERRIIQKISSRGKLLFIQFSDFSSKMHFLMFGSYRINEERKGITRGSLLALMTGHSIPIIVL